MAQRTDKNKDVTTEHYAKLSEDEESRHLGRTARFAASSDLGASVAASRLTSNTKR